MKKYYLGLLAVYLLVYILPLGGRPLITPDEFRYGKISLEMVRCGNWITPRLIGVRYFEKPVMGYWLNALSLATFGKNAFAVRFSSALATGLAALLLFLLVRHKNNDPELATVVTALFLASGLVFGVGTFAVLDAPTSLFLTGTLVAFFFACEPPKSGRRRFLFLIAAGIFAGFGFLTKGFLAFVVPAIVIVPYLLWNRRWKEIFVLPWLPALAALITVLPWAVAIHLQEPDFWRYFIFVEHFQRFLGNEATQHPEPFWYFIPVLLIGFMPWTLFAPCGFIGLKTFFKEAYENRLLRFAACWLIVPFVFFSMSSGKLGTYILPCYPGGAILLGWGLLSYLRNNGYKTFDLIAKIILVALVVGAVGFTAFQLLADYGVLPGLFFIDERPFWLLSVGAGVFWIIALLKMLKTKNYRHKLIWLFIGPVMAFFLSHFVAPRRVLKGKAQGLFLEQFQDRVGTDAILVAHPNVMHAAAWVFDHLEMRLYTHGGELSEGLEYPDSRDRLISRNEFMQLLQDTFPPGGVIFIMRGDFREGIPPADFECYEHGIMFSHYKRKITAEPQAKEPR